VLQFAFWYVLFWTGLAFFFASQIYFLDRGRVPWTIALSFSAPRWYSWGLFAPGVFWVDKRLGTGRSLAARVGLHVPLGRVFGRSFSRTFCSTRSIPSARSPRRVLRQRAA
jgi:hypothetical protein